MREHRTTCGPLVSDWLTDAAVTTPDAPVVVERTGTVTYGELNRRANQVANLLIASGVHRGDRILLAIENSATWVSCYFGILKAGAVVVPLPHGDRSDRLPHAIGDATPAVCIVDARMAGSVVQIEGRHQVLTVGARGADTLGAVLSLEEATRWSSIDEPRRRGIDLDLAAIIYTSGSTGAPRGVMLSHLNLRANTESIVEYLRLTSADRVMAVLPFYYVYGLSLLNTHVFVGGSVVIENRFAFPAAALKAMQEHAVTGFAGVPSTFTFLLHRSPIVSMEFPTLRYVTQAGGPMAHAHIRDWREVMPHVPFYVMYGATEAGARLAYLEPGELERRPGSIGRAIPNVELKIVCDDGRPAAPGEVGELVAKGSNISAGYWMNAEETRAAFGPDGYRTGDLAYADEDGFLYLVGRRNDMLKVGAHRVGAREIEEVISEHPSIYEVAVVGEAHDLLGEVPVAFVTSRNGQIDTAEIVAFCRSLLPDHKVPARIVVRDELPKSGAGKIDKRRLRASLSVEPVTVESRGV
jgi:acyl-CoA synthetase (AMP-forming)/AMP-acid ligase II